MVGEKEGDPMAKPSCKMLTISSIAAHAKTIPFFNVPIPDISTSTSFPGFRYRGGFMAKPTPRKKYQR